MNRPQSPEPLRIVWDGESMVAIEKPAGVLTQAPKHIDSVERRLREQLAGRSDYVAMVHRLDRGVSGILLVAIRKRVARLLSDQFVTRKVQKKYLAVVSGRPDPSEQVWVDYLRKIPNEARAERCEAMDLDAKRAETHMQWVRDFPDHDCSLLRLTPVTGRMHQLRVQAAKRGHPILGDLTYGGHVNPAVHESLPADRILLHAEAISFHDPRNGARITVECPLEIPTFLG
ncbi:RluA family pseudouridine synthase [Novipirellula artificiosorum]|uniref:Ribosomal large subunit pseudouridine synthase A n=1 Tax=Novipirellula artificiosorum TaxID=2528016 RepID=A0A5C6DHR3_9BACT|nr:RluA family pseudouridine synthase [Novipirellula artificiosorum]TWU36208.1 Ribosomal large subunit pseudouridine synthase A [Novipirellula artificiosorum]